MKKRTLKLNRETLGLLTAGATQRAAGGSWVCTGSCGTDHTCGCLTGACNTFDCGTQTICI